MISNIIINKIYIFQSIRYKSNNHYDMYQCGIIIKNVKDNQSYDEMSNGMNLYRYAFINDTLKMRFTYVFLFL